MDIKSILKIGFKVLIAGVTGFAMYIGLNRKNNTNNQDQNTQPEYSCENDKQNPQIVQQSNCDNYEFVDKLKNVQEIGGKLLTFIQSLTMTADSFSKIFRSNNNSYIGQQSSYFCNSWENNYRRPINFGNGVMGNRISPFIMEIY